MLRPRTGALRRRDFQAGFSLIEVMVAILILGVAIAGLTEGLSVALNSSKESEWQTTAALFAAGRIETLRAEGTFHDETTEGSCGDILPLYRWRQSVKSAGIEGLHDVEVVVENARSGTAIYSLRTLLFEAPTPPTLEPNAPDRRPGSSPRTGRNRRS